MPKASIVKAYFGAIIFTAMTALVAWINGDNSITIFHKALVGPLYLLATTGLRSFFPEELDLRRGIVGTAEYHFLNAAILGAFMLLVLEPHAGNLRAQLVSFGFFVSFVGTVNFGRAILERRKIGSRL